MKRRLVVLIAVIVLIAASLATARWWSSRESLEELEVSGTVEATESRLGFQSGGRIAEIAVREGDRIERGTVLARLDTAEIDARRMQAVARADAARALLRELTSGSRGEEIGQAEAMVEAARERLEDARRDLARNRALHEGGAISLEILQKSEAVAGVAAAQHEQAREQLRLLRSGARRERVDAQRAVVREADAAVAAIDAILANAQVIAPFGGIVTVRHHEPNETVAPGQPVVTLIDPNDRWVRVYIPENRIGAVRLGSTATIESDTYPGKHYEGRIVHIASEAEFTPKNVQTAEERVRLVYAVKVRIAGDPAMELKPGIPVDVVLPVAH